MPIETNEDLSEHFNCMHCSQCCNFFEMIVNPQNLKLNDLLVNEAFKKELNVEFGVISQCSIRINATCIHLDKKTGLCLIHDNRPNICKNHFCQRYPKIDIENIGE